MYDEFILHRTRRLQLKHGCDFLDRVCGQNKARVATRDPHGPCMVAGSHTRLIRISYARRIPQYDVDGPVHDRETSNSSIKEANYACENQRVEKMSLTNMMQ